MIESRTEMMIVLKKTGRQKEKQSHNHNKEIRHMGAGEGFSGTILDTDESRFLTSMNTLRYQGIEKRRAEEAKETELRKVKKRDARENKKNNRENQLEEAIAEIFLHETTKKFGVSTAQIAALGDDELLLLDTWLMRRSRRRRMASALMCAAVPILGWIIGLLNLLVRSDRSSRMTGHYAFYRKKLDRKRKAPSFPFEKVHRLADGQNAPNAQKQDVAKTVLNDTYAKTAQKISRPASGAWISLNPIELLLRKLYRLRAENEHKSEETRKRNSQDYFVSCFLRAAAHYYFLDGVRIAAMTDAELEMLDALIMRRTRHIRVFMQSALIVGFLGVPIIGWTIGVLYLLTRRNYLLCQEYNGHELFLCRYKFFRKTFHNIHSASSFPHERIRQCTANGFN